MDPAPLYYLPVLHQPSNDCNSLIAPLLPTDERAISDMVEALTKLTCQLTLPVSHALLALLENACTALSMIDQDAALSIQPGEEGGLIAGNILTASMLVAVLKRAGRAEDAELGEATMECCGVLTALLSGHGEHTLRIGLTASGRPPLALRCVPQGWCTGTRLWPASRLAIGALAAGWQGLRVDGRSVLEIGCGLAAAGLACAALGASPVWLTDCDEAALAMAEGNARLNGVDGACRVAHLDFMAAAPLTDANDATSEMPHTFDVVVACDVLYDWNGSWRETLGAIARYLAVSPDSRALCCFGTQKRSEAARGAVADFTHAVHCGDACGLRLIASESIGEDGQEGVRMLLLERCS